MIKTLKKRGEKVKFKVHPENKNKAKVITSGGEIIIEENLKNESGKNVVLVKFMPIRDGKNDHTLSHSHVLTRITEL